MPTSLEELGLTGFVGGRFKIASGVDGIDLKTAGDRAYQCSIRAEGVPATEMRCEGGMGLVKASLREAWDAGVDEG